MFNMMTARSKDKNRIAVLPGEEDMLKAFQMIDGGAHEFVMSRGRDYQWLWPTKVTCYNRGDHLYRIGHGPPITVPLRGGGEFRGPAERVEPTALLGDDPIAGESLNRERLSGGVAALDVRLPPGGPPTLIHPVYINPCPILQYEGFIRDVASLKAREYERPIYYWGYSFTGRVAQGWVGPDGHTCQPPSTPYSGPDPKPTVDAETAPRPLNRMVGAVELLVSWARE